MYQEKLPIPKIGYEVNDSSVLEISAEELQELLRIFDENKPLTFDEKGIPLRKARKIPIKR